MSHVFSKRFHSFKAELELYEENGEPRSSCFIMKGNACSSLALAEDFGFIEGDFGEEIPVADSIINRIRKWAEAHGY